MRKIVARYLIITFFLILLCLSQGISAKAYNQPEKHVLILHPFTPIFPAHEQYNQGLIEELNKNTDYKFSYSFEYLDYPRYSHDPGYFENIAGYLKIKYKNHPPDFIITQANVMKLLYDYGRDIFPPVPVIISRDHTPSTPVAEEYFNLFAVQQATDIERNIELILATRPGTKKIYMIIGDSADERVFAERLPEMAEKYNDDIDIFITRAMSYGQMIDTVQKAEADSAILYFRWLTDSEGAGYIPEQVAADICETAKVPVYGVDIRYIGNGMVGGYVREQKLAGTAAADIILEILGTGNGPTVQKVRLVENRSVFDWRQLKKWEIDTKKLPPESRIEYSETSIWEKYKHYILGGSALLILETILLLGLLISHNQRRKAEGQLLKTNDALKGLTEKLIEQDKIKDEFLAITSHELQTPLNGIINISEALLEGSHGEMAHSQKDELAIILAVSKRLSNMIRDIIDFERIKRDELEINLEPVDLTGIFAMVTDVFRYIVNDSEIKLILDVPDELPPVTADKNRLIQVLYNVLGNAIKFTSKGTITIRAKEEEAYIKIFVEDTGTGITKEIQELLFDAFMQGNQHILRQYEGSGLGLYISKKLTEGMSGRISLEWSEPGEGSCFSIQIPKSKYELTKINKQRKGERALPDSATPEGKGEAAKEFVLLAVDDENTNLRVLKSIFLKEGYTVLTASNGQEAMEIVQNRLDVDLVLMDVMMPGMSGYETCRTIREHHSLYDLPVLMLTVRNAPEDILAGFSAGANDFVSKPFVAKELKARVATLLLMKKSVQDALKNEMAFLQAQIKPHFLYNALSTIMSFCHTDSVKAGELLAYLSEYLQKSFNIDDTASTVSIKNEIELTKAYTEIEKARFGDRLSVEFYIEEELISHRILPLTIQPIVENAIRHGLMMRKSGGTVTIEIGKDVDIPHMIKVMVSDDGVGMDEVKEAMDDKTLDHGTGGVGLANIRRRLMNQYGSALYISSGKDVGTKVWFNIPKQG